MPFNPQLSTLLKSVAERLVAFTNVLRKVVAAEVEKKEMRT